MDRKEKQLQRYLKGMKHFRTLDERKELKRRSHERKGQQAHRTRGGGRRHDWELEEDDSAGFENIPRSPSYRPGQAAGSPPAASAGALAGQEVEEGTPVATVVFAAPGRARVLQDGVERDVVLSEELARTQKTSLAVGDEVLLEERDGALPRLHTVLERRSSISRPDPGRPNVERVIAANVDRAVVVVSVRRPAFRPRLIDRYLIALERGGVEPVVCANKVDLVQDEEERQELDQRLAPYRAIGAPALLTSGVSGEGVEELRELLVARTVVFVGQSGVGKSSLLNALAPELGLVIGEVRESDGKGRHTTTSSMLVDLGQGTRWIDTPGIRGFKLAAVTRANLASHFPDLSALRGGCRFRDCSHTQEPACAVRAALEQGELSRFRYDTYLRILASLSE